MEPKRTSSKIGPFADQKTLQAAREKTQKHKAGKATRPLQYKVEEATMHIFKKMAQGILLGGFKPIRDLWYPEYSDSDDMYRVYFITLGTPFVAMGAISALGMVPLAIQKLAERVFGKPIDLLREKQGFGFLLSKKDRKKDITLEYVTRFSTDRIEKNYQKGRIDKRTYNFLKDTKKNLPKLKANLDKETEGLEKEAKKIKNEIKKLKEPSFKLGWNHGDRRRDLESIESIIQLEKLKTSSPRLPKLKAKQEIIQSQIEQIEKEQAELNNVKQQKSEELVKIVDKICQKHTEYMEKTKEMRTELNAIRTDKYSDYRDKNLAKLEGVFIKQYKKHLKNNKISEKDITIESFIETKINKMWNKYIDTTPAGLQPMDRDQFIEDLISRSIPTYQKSTYGPVDWKDADEASLKARIDEIRHKYLGQSPKQYPPIIGVFI